MSKWKKRKVKCAFYNCNNLVDFSNGPYNHIPICLKHRHTSMLRETDPKDYNPIVGILKEKDDFLEIGKEAMKLGKASKETAEIIKRLREKKEKEL